MAHVAEWKKDELIYLTNMIIDNPVVGIVNIENIPAKQMADMRKNLQGVVSFRVAKITLIKLALENSNKSKEGIAEMASKLPGKQCALVAGDMNAFRLYAEMERTITPSPARGGDTAPQDIVVEKGETSFKPGPIVGEFGKAGIPAAIEKGKVVIKKTSTVCKEGDVISRDLANMLTKLEIFPMKVGLNLLTAYEDGTVFEPKMLHIDEDAYRGDIATAASHAFNLAMFAAITTPITVEPLVQKAVREAMNLSINAGIPTKENMPMLLAKAYMEMLALASNAGDGLDDELRDKLSNAPAPAAPAADSGGADSTDDSPPEEEEEEGATEEEAMAGLGALFG